ncbi:MAG: ABC transporter permease, partial [Bacillota bacterium]
MSSVEQEMFGLKAQSLRLGKVFARHKVGVVGVVMVALFVGAAVLAPYVAPYDPYTMNLDNAFQPPSSPGHILGTDNFGRDILSRLIYGSRISLLIGIVVVSIATVSGT